MSASGSGSVIGRDPLPPRQVVPPPVVDQAPPITHNPDLIHHKRPERGWSLQLSAGELLGRTHEELVLLLIQLRRQSAGFCKAMEACHMEIEAQARLVELETPKRMEHLQKLEDLKRHLLELEKQYEKGKPLVNLVDNMVKLGSLYRVGAPLPGASPTTAPLLRDRLEFNHQVQERRLLAEERRDWERLSPDHNQLQAKVEQLYRLDRLLQEESGTLQSLQQDKEMLERALGGLRHKLQAVGSNPAQAEKYRRQQRLLERELSRVRSILAHNSKKLEETVAENARLEQELVVLRQKLVWSRRAPDQSVSSTAQLEAELARVQSLVGDLQRQRLELSSQVRQLTERSNSLSQQIRPSPTGVQAYQMGYYRTYPGVGAVGSKKTLTSSWLETDLDTQVTQDLGRDSPLAPQASPLYVNTDVSKSLDVCSTYEGSVSQDDQQELTSAPPTPQQAPPPPPPPAQSPAHYTRPMAPMDISEADDRIKRFYGIIPRDKPQEIKTVRIVKRESERRQRDRDRSGNIGIPLTNTTTAKRVTIIEENVPVESVDRGLGRVVEEQPEPPSEVFGGSLAPRPPPAPGPRSDSVQALRNLVTRQRARLDSDSTSPSHSVSAHEQLFGSSDTLLSPQLSPVYQSQAARQIVEEMAVTNRRAVPREKRRHHTVSGRPLLRIDTSYSAGGSRDDLDMERALRPRLNTPDVVRSTLSRSEVKYTTETIDSILGTPGKILIPERYVPESTPELSSEEQQRRNKKAESIRKMLSETTQISAPDDNNEPVEEDEKSLTLKKKVAEEKRQREHLLQLNQILAHQVMEKSKMVAGSNAASTQD
ncbi:Pleckstrin y domain-containing A member 5 [Homalodisca vitripennis]|nr:Pleckstrin y domain-containing A member 5 [Homalodisca vitripennis]